jgi:hypothetical protein
MQTRDAGLPKITLGWELEATGRARRAVQGVEVGHDGSVHGDGLEYRIKRELVYTPEKSLEALRTLATDPALQVDASCGFHVHVGLGQRKRKIHDWAAAFVTLAREVEDYAFAAVPASRRQNQYCRSWKNTKGSIVATQYSASKHANQNRYNWVNPVEIFRPGGIRTIEIRLLGNTKRYTYLLAWVAVCRMMAMSAWAVANDISRLEGEKEEIQKAMSLIKDNFLRADIPTKVVAKTALYLANKGGLLTPFGKPLEEISKRETDIAYRLQMEESERREYDQLMAALRQSVDEYRARMIATGEPPVGALIPGDTVQCTRTSDYMTVGNYYRVVSAWEGGCRVLNDEGSSWELNANSVRLVERIGQQACAV